jgi:hypothetical protein
MALKERQIKVAMYVKEKGNANKEYRVVSGHSDEGARIDLKFLVEKGIIMQRAELEVLIMLLSNLAFIWPLFGNFGDILVKQTANNGLK